MHGFNFRTVRHFSQSPQNYICPNKTTFTVYRPYNELRKMLIFFKEVVQCNLAITWCFEFNYLDRIISGFKIWDKLENKRKNEISFGYFTCKKWIQLQNKWCTSILIDTGKPFSHISLAHLPRSVTQPPRTVIYNF